MRPETSSRSPTTVAAGSGRKSAGTATATERSSSRLTEFTYDDQGRLWKVKAPGDRVTEYEYDGRGLKTKETDPDGGITLFEYDLAGRLTKRTDPLGYVTRWEYDLRGKLMKVTDAKGNPTTYAYDARGLLVAETRGELRSTTRRAPPTFRPGASPTTVVGTAKRPPTRMGRSRPSRTTTPGASPAAPFRRLRASAASTRPRSPSTFSAAPTPNGPSPARPASTGPAGSIHSTGPARRRSGSAPDPSGASAALSTWPTIRSRSPTRRAGRSSRSYDPLNRLAEVRSAAGDVLVHYDDLGSRQLRKVLGNGLTEERQYDPSGWLEHLDVGPAANPNGTFSVTYGRNGRSLKTDVKRADLGKRHAYEYDAASRILREQLGLLEPPPPAPAPNPPEVENFLTLDGLLNIVTEERTEAGTKVTTSSATNSRNQVTQWGSDAATYDANGNVASFRGRTLHYDADNRLVSALLPGGGTYEVLRDASGRKVRETLTASGTTHAIDVVQDGDRTLETFAANEGVPLESLVYGRGIDEVVRADLDPDGDGTATTVIPIQDELGNVAYLTGPDGTVLERYDYETYGRFRVFAPDGSARTTSAFGWNRLFQGREYVAALEAYDFRNRHLLPALGRFAQEDPLGYVDSLNLYQAFGGGWVNATDPWGLAVGASREQLERIDDARGVTRASVTNAGAGDPGRRGLGMRRLGGDSSPGTRGSSGHGNRMRSRVSLTVRERARAWLRARSSPRAGRHRRSRDSQVGARERGRVGSCARRWSGAGRPGIDDGQRGGPGRYVTKRGATTADGRCAGRTDAEPIRLVAQSGGTYRAR